MAKKKGNKNIDIEDYITSIIEDTEMSDEMKQSYIDYAMVVIRSRALPDVRDGLKPVNRRILHAMNELHLTPNSNYRKSARIVGDTLGKFHPHGDSSVYSAMVRMGQDFKNSLTLVEGQGNFGSIDGDSAASMRYTEAKLTNTAMMMLDELKNDVVDFKFNFDDSEKEPVILPNKIPGLLINGSNGIAVGMATNIPTHNPVEVINGYMAFIDNQDISIDRLCEYIPCPDFPTGGLIVNGEEFKNTFYHKGEGTLRVRSKYHIEDVGYGRKNIVITEIPFSLSGNKRALLDKILDMIKDKKLDECTSARDESNKDGIRIVIEVKKGVNVDKVIKKLLAKTAMEDSTKYKFLALNSESEPITYNLKTYFEDILKFQREFYTRKYQKILNTSELRKELLDGYISAYHVIRVIIEVILNTKGKNQEESKSLVKNVLMYGDINYLESTDIMKKYIKIAREFRFTERQANSILSRPLSSLMHFEIEGYIKELETVNKTIAECQAIITNEKELNKVIKKELRSIKKDLDETRKTEIDNIDRATYKETINIEEFLLTIDNLGYVKLLDVPKNYNKDDYMDYKYVEVVQNIDNLRFFTNKGNYIQLKLLGVDKTKGKDRGKLIETYLELLEDEKIIAIEVQSKLVKQDLIILSKNGLLKKMEGVELDTNYTNISYSKLEDEDEFFAILFVDKDLHYDIRVTDVNNTSKTVDKLDIKSGKKTAKGNKVFKNSEVKAISLIEKDAPEIVEENVQEMFISFNDDGELVEFN